MKNSQVVIKCPKCKRRRLRKGPDRFQCRKCRHTWEAPEAHVTK